MTIRVGNQTVFDANRNPIVGSLAANPSAPTAGTLIFDSNNRVIKGWNGTTWVNLTQGGNGGALAWGGNLVGRLGDGTTSNRLSPVSVVGGFTDWVQISASAGSGHVSAIRANGMAWTWGSNNYSQLGDNTTSNRSSPVSVVGGFSDWVQISAGKKHTSAIRANGTAWAWGFNAEGVLGDGTTFATSSPVSVVGGFTDWVQISAGDGHTAAIRANGTAWCWGSNYAGQLGDNTLSSRISPVSVVGGFSDWVQISAGSAHTVAIRSNGTAWGWGRNDYGQLGNNTVLNSRSSPVSVVGGFTDWVQISACFRRIAAVRANGTAWGWGFNNAGSIGDGTASHRSSPVSVVGGFTDWVQISAGAQHTTGLRANGTAWAWGYNNFSQLGDNTTLTSSSPVSVVSGFSDWVQISAGLQFTIALRFT